MTHRAKKSVSVIGIALVCAFAALSFRTLSGHEPSGGEGEAPAVTLPTSVEVLLLRAGMDPDALAAVGVTGATLSTQLAAAGETLGTFPATLASADADYAAARVARDRLERRIRSGQGDQEDVTALAQARADLADAEAARAAVLDDAFEALTVGVAPARVAKLAQIRANGQWHVPVKYKVASREAAAWLSIRDCLAHIRTYADLEMEPLPGPSSTLAAFDGEQAVSDAATDLAANLSGVQAVWDATFVD